MQFFGMKPTFELTMAVKRSSSGVHMAVDEMRGIGRRRRSVISLWTSYERSLLTSFRVDWKGGGDSDELSRSDLIVEWTKSVGGGSSLSATRCVARRRPSTSTDVGRDQRPTDRLN